MKQVPQLIHADHLRDDWVLVCMEEAHGDVWMLARPLSSGSLFTRFKLAWKVFTGECDALKWYRQ